jgi:general secretion pathway protein G
MTASTIYTASKKSDSPSTHKGGKGTKKGFTLIEILIVVIILGILAAIVIPQFSSASSDARKASLQSTVQTLRSQVALYKLQHGDTLPDLTTAWTPLTATSTYNGTTYGPYMQSTPTNPLTNGTVVKNGTFGGTAVTGADYVYDYNSANGSGNIWGASNTTTGALVP